MSVILILILASLAVAAAFLTCFIWAVKAGQYEDTCTPAMRILAEDEPAPIASNVLSAKDASGRLKAAPLPGARGADGNPKGCQDASKPSVCSTT